VVPLDGNGAREKLSPEEAPAQAGDGTTVPQKPARRPRKPRAPKIEAPEQPVATAPEDGRSQLSPVEEHQGNDAA
jgi:hypothetical protein